MAAARRRPSSEPMKQVKVGLHDAAIELLKAKAASAGLSLSSFIARRALGKEPRLVPQIDLPIMTKLVEVGNHLTNADELLRLGASQAEVRRAIAAAAHALGEAANGPSSE